MWIETYTGKKFHLLEPHEDEVDIIDIAHALSQLCRFTGHSKTFYSIAQHSVLVSNLIDPQYAFAGLLHDAPEAYIGDWSRPLQKLPSLKSILEPIHKKIYLAVCSRYGVCIDDNMLKAVAKADDILLATEVRDLMHNTELWSNVYGPPLPQVISPWTDKVAFITFLSRFVDLTMGIRK